MNAPKTVQQARLLPEVGSFYSGNYFFGSRGVEGDDIIAFIDEDGFTKKVQCIRYEKDGQDVWVKTRLYL